MSLRLQLKVSLFGLLAYVVIQGTLNINRVGVVALADPRDHHAMGEVADVLVRWSLPVPVPVFGRIALDPSGAAGLGGQWGRRLDRSLLIESARVLARDLDALLTDRRPAA